MPKGWFRLRKSVFAKYVMSGFMRSFLQITHLKPTYVKMQKQQIHSVASMAFEKLHSVHDITS
jgi:hypothetical protein